ncbi:MAG: hypothetical protein MR373_05880, partial [Faecalibacterium prausnitzii]|nr:hypothetical protein [Faecalibacterium prausnitzii]
CLHGGTQGGKALRNSIHTHKIAFFPFFAGKTSGGGGLLQLIVSFPTKECNAGENKPSPSSLRDATSPRKGELANTVSLRGLAPSQRELAKPSGFD